MKYLVFVGAIVYLLGTSIYIRAMFKGEAKPNKVSWFMWSVAPLIGTFAALSAGARISCNSCIYVRIWTIINFYNIIIYKKFILAN